MYIFLFHDRTALFCERHTCVPKLPYIRWVPVQGGLFMVPKLSRKHEYFWLLFCFPVGYTKLLYNLIFRLNSSGSEPLLTGPPSFLCVLFDFPFRACSVVKKCSRKSFRDISMVILPVLVFIRVFYAFFNRASQLTIFLEQNFWCVVYVYFMIIPLHRKPLYDIARYSSL